MGISEGGVKEQIVIQTVLLPLKNASVLKMVGLGKTAIKAKEYWEIDWAAKTATCQVVNESYTSMVTIIERTDIFINGSGNVVLKRTMNLSVFLVPKFALKLGLKKYK